SYDCSHLTSPIETVLQYFGGSCPKHLFLPQFRCSSRILNESTPILCCWMRSRKPIGPGKAASKCRPLLYFQFFGTACHTASAKLWNNMINKLQVTARQSRIDNVDPVYTGVLPVFQ